MMATVAQETPMPKATVTLEAAADYIGVSSSWLYKHKSQIPHARFNRRIHFRVPDLDRWLEAQMVRPSR